jgi:hypothetical protein
MGRGIVATSSDFGQRGEAPTHPELLDYLARQLVAGGWKLKPIHKLILQSAVYRQSSAIDPAKARVDDTNRLWWRKPPERLEAEVIRDALLAVGGNLDPRMFGAGSLDQAHPRRSIYLTVKRSQLVPMMQVFDAPEGLAGVAQRPVTTIAPQALLMMNNPLARRGAEGLARRAAEGNASSPEQVRRVYEIAVSRPPTDQELTDSLAFLASQSASHQSAGHPHPGQRAAVDFCQAILWLNEFVYAE